MDYGLRECVCMPKDICPSLNVYLSCKYSERRLSRMCVYLFMCESVNRNEPEYYGANTERAPFKVFPFSRCA